MGKQRQLKLKLLIYRSILLSQSHLAAIAQILADFPLFQLFSWLSLRP